MREPASLDRGKSRLGELDPLLDTPFEEVSGPAGSSAPKGRRQGVERVRGVGARGSVARGPGPSRFLGTIGGRQKPAKKRGVTLVPERTIGEPDYLPVAFLQLGAKRARAVAHLEYTHEGREYYGTGFMVSPTLMLTNHHVFSSAAAARDAKVFFDYEADERGRPRRPSVFLTAPERFFLANERLDFALVAIAEEPGGEWGCVQLCHAPMDLRAGGRVNLIQHPKGGLKQVVLTGNQIVAVGDVALRYLADTEGGSSGSPVFNQRWELVALHHMGSAQENVGVRSDRILKFLTVAGAERGASPLLTELLARVPDSGDLGWFGGAGLSAPSLSAGPGEGARAPGEVMRSGQPAGGGGAPPMEAQALAWQGGAGFLDLGHWSLQRASFDSSEAIVVDAVAETLARAGADLTVLEGVPEAAREAVMAALAEEGLGATRLGASALVCTDAAIALTPRPPDEAGRALLAARMRGRPVIPEGALAVFDGVLRRPNCEGERRFTAVILELDPSFALPSRHHRSEMARLIREHCPSFGTDVVVVGSLGALVEQPALLEGGALELSIVRRRAGGQGGEGGELEAGAVLWLEDGKGQALEAIHLPPGVVAVHRPETVSVHETARALPVASALAGLEAPLLVRLCFEAELPAAPGDVEAERNAGKAAPPAGSSSPPDVGEEAPTRGGRRELSIDAHVRSIIVVTGDEDGKP